jgi:hypothetical protein
LEIIRRDIHDGRLVRLIEGLLRAGYMQDWRSYDTFSGTPQGGIISPLLTNIYLNELDRYVEDTLIPAYTRSERRREDPGYTRLTAQIRAARKGGNREEAHRLIQQRRKVASVDGFDPDYRRLRYIRYADDFLLGFAGPKEEAQAIRDRLAEFLGQRLRLRLSMEKTLITHAVDEQARFLGYELKVSRCNTRLTRGMRTANGGIALLMPRQVVSRLQNRFSREGKITHRIDLVHETDYTTVQRYQAILRGVYNYYCMAVNVGNRTRMGRIKWVLGMSLTKTLAYKHKCSVNSIYARHRVDTLDGAALRVVVERPGKESLVATFGGIPFERNPEGMGTVDFRFEKAWFSQRLEVVQRLLAGKCELCEAEGPLQMHHIRKLADLDRPGRRPKAGWQRIMSARKRKTLAVCEDCHQAIHAGRYDGPSLCGSLESRMR